MAVQGRRLAAELEALAAQHQIPLSVTSAGSLVSLHGDEDLLEATHLLALAHGLYIAPRGMMALSTVMTDPLLDEVCERFAAVFADAAGRA